MADDTSSTSSIIVDNSDNMFDVIVPEQIDKRILRLLLIIREVLDRAFFSNYYNKRVLMDQVSNIDNFDVDVLVKKFSFIQLDEREEKTLTKDVIFETLKVFITDDIVRAMLKIYYAYNRTNIENYEDEYDGHVLVEMAQKVAPCLTSYGRSKCFNMEFIELDASDFIEYLLKKIVGMSEEDFISGKSTFYNLLMQILLCFKRVSFLRKTILETITILITNLHRWLEQHKKKFVTPLQAEIVALLLMTAIEILHMVSAVAKINPSSINIPAGNPREYQNLYNALHQLQSHVPEYIAFEIDEALDLIYSY